MDWDRVGGARRLARTILAIAVVATIFAAFSLMTSSDPMFGGPRSIDSNREPITMPWLLEVVGFVAALVGLAWMWRIYRAPTKNDEAVWRYRDRN